MLRFFGTRSVIRIADVLDRTAVGLADLREPTMDNGPGLWESYEPKWRRSRRQMYATQGRYTGVRWKPYQMRRRGERTYVAIKRSIYANAGKRFDPDRDLLRWIRGHELLFPSLAARTAYTVYQPGPRKLIVGTKLGYAARLGKRGRIPDRLGGGRHPARPLLNMEGRALMDLRRVAVEYVTRQEKGLTAQVAKETVGRTAGFRR